MNRFRNATISIMLAFFMAIFASPAMASATPCYEVTVAPEARYKKVIEGQKEIKHTEYRFRTRTYIENKLEVKDVFGYNFVDGGTTRVNGQTVAGHWVKSDGWHRIPAVIINIVWGPSGPPPSVLGSGVVNLSVYGGPNVRVNYKAYVQNFSGWSDWGPWSSWSTTNPGGNTESRNTETRVVIDRESTPDKTVYYLPGGSSSETLGESNWTTETPNSPWVLIDRRNREVKREVECAPNKIVRTFQVDTYSNPTTKLAKKAAGYDNNGSLSFGEDKAHYGHSRWQIVKVTGYSNWNHSQWRTAINKATTKTGVKSVTSASHLGSVSKGKSVTVAWEILAGSWRNSGGGAPQVFFASGR